MAIDFMLACIQCKEYLNLHKWCPDEKIEALRKISSDFPEAIPVSWKINCQILMESIKVQRGTILIEYPDHWIADSACDIEKFCFIHGSHTLRLYNDTGTLPWYESEKDWYYWKEIKGRMSCWDEKFTDVSLPRNIIDDMCITKWDKALKHYTENCPMVENPKKLEVIFLEFIRYIRKEKGNNR